MQEMVRLSPSVAGTYVLKHNYDGYETVAINCLNGTLNCKRLKKDEDYYISGRELRVPDEAAERVLPGVIYLFSSEPPALMFHFDDTYEVQKIVVPVEVKNAHDIHIRVNSAIPIDLSPYVTLRWQGEEIYRKELTIPQHDGTIFVEVQLSMPAEVKQQLIPGEFPALNLIVEYEEW